MRIERVFLNRNPLTTVERFVRDDCSHPRTFIVRPENVTFCQVCWFEVQVNESAE